MQVKGVKYEHVYGCVSWSENPLKAFIHTNASQQTKSGPKLS